MSEAGAELRAATSDEMRAEARAAEDAASRLRLRCVTLAEVVADVARRGDPVRVEVCSVRFGGHVVFAGGDLATIALHGGGTLHVDLAAPIAIVLDRGPRRSGAPARPASGAGSLWAQVRAAELTAARVRLIGPAPANPPAGTVAVAASDHLVFAAAGTRWIVPRAGVWGLIEEP
jgi:hypothetical protein